MTHVPGQLPGYIPGYHIPGTLIPGGAVVEQERQADAARQATADAERRTAKRRANLLLLLSQ